MWVLSRKTVTISTILFAGLILCVALLSLRYIDAETRAVHDRRDMDIHEAIDLTAIQMANFERVLSNLLINNGNSSDEDVVSSYQALTAAARLLKERTPRSVDRVSTNIAEAIEDLDTAIERTEPLLQTPDDLTWIEAARNHIISAKKIVNALRLEGSDYGIAHIRDYYDRLEKRFINFVIASSVLGFVVVALIAMLARQVIVLRQTNRHALSLAQHLTEATRDLERASADIENTNRELESQNRRLVANEAELERQNYLFQAALSNMKEGLCMLDASERVVIANSAYMAIYGLDPRRCKPGITIDDLILQLAEAGLTTSDYMNKLREKRWNHRAQHLPMTRDRLLTDGRTIEIHERPLDDGGWLTTHEDVTEARRSHASAQHLATHDPLTGLANRTKFNHTLSLAIASRGGAAAEIALILFDLDRFKSVNDLHGHAAGDRLLEMLARRLQSVAGDQHLVARLGGDEFGVIVLGSAVVDVARRVAAEIVDLVKTPFDLGFARAEIGVSIGVAVTPDHGTDSHMLMRNADLALYTVKSARLNTYQFYDPAMSVKLEERRVLEAELAQALIAGQLQLHYQPIVASDTGRILGAEALLRWTSPTMGPVPADRIIQIANETGLIFAMGDWIIDEAVRTAASWPVDLSIAINLSGRQFRKHDLARSILDTLDRHRISADRLHLEVTETVLCEDAAGPVMSELRQSGIRFSLDDFGTGYASLSYLTRFPFDIIKIDKSFVRNAPDRVDCRAIIDTVCRLAAALGLETLAEGIESERELDIVRAAGCGHAQGYLFGRPVPASDFLTLVGSQRPRAARPRASAPAA